VADPGEEKIRPFPPPSSVAIDFGPLQQRNKCDILENILNFPLAKCLDLPLEVGSRALINGNLEGCYINPCND